MYYEMELYPAPLSKKITLLRYFRSYMNDHLLKVLFVDRVQRWECCLGGRERGAARWR